MLHRLMIVVMSSDRQLDVKNIIMLLTILQDEVNSEAAVPNTRYMVRCCILSLLIQLARGILISGKQEKNSDIVEKAMAVEKALLSVARTRAYQENGTIILAVCPVTGLLAAKEIRIEKPTDFTDFSEPDNLCELFETLTPMPVEEELREWFQRINEVHTKYSKGISDAPTHVS